ncbi:hypothetical protein AAG906_003917 [Vitis piasezkii]
MCPGFQSLTQAGLQHLTSLETLSIRDYSLCYLSVNYCPLLEQRCQFEKGPEWCYIAHIPQVEINGVLIFSEIGDLEQGRLIPGRLHLKHTTKSHISWNCSAYLSGGLLSFSPPISLMQAWGNLGGIRKESCYHGAEAYPFIFAEIEFKRALALSSLEELRISNFPKLQLLDRCALFWNINDNLQTGRLEWLLLHSHYGTTCCF